MDPFTNRPFGYIKDTDDTRDHLIKFTADHARNFIANKDSNIDTVEIEPTLFDLRKIVQLPDVLNEIDQGHLASCTANAVAYAYTFDEIKQSNKHTFFPSRLFIYYNTRLEDRTLTVDSGAQIRSVIKSINKYGICAERKWIYEPSKFADKPSEETYKEADLVKSVSYARLNFSGDKTIEDRINHIKLALRSGFPIIFGFVVHESFRSDAVIKTGIVPMPNAGEKVIGSHTACVIGYDNDKEHFIVKNSWGNKWGDNGCFYMPYKYLANLDYVEDLWVIKEVTNPENLPDWKEEDINPLFKNLDATASGDGIIYSSLKYVGSWFGY